MVEPLTTFTATADKYGGYIELNWAYPDDGQVDNWQLYIFKRKTTAVTDQEIADYFAGELTDEELKQINIWVFRDIPRNVAYKAMKDFTVEVGVTYYYVAVIKNIDLPEYSTKLTASAKPDPQIYISTVDTKGLVVRAIEKIIDVVKNGSGEKPVIPKVINVVKSFSLPKGEDCVIVVSRGAGQVIQKTWGMLYAEYEDKIVKGEIDLDVLVVEWLSYISDRRDQITNLMRAMRSLIYKYLMAMGNGDVMDVRFIMGGDSQGQGTEGQADMMRGTMTVAVVVNSLIQIGGARELLPYLIFQPTVPMINIVPSILNFGAIGVGEESILSYHLSANYLTPDSGNITVTAPEGFQVSLSQDTGYLTELDVPYTIGKLDSTKIYVKYSPTEIKDYTNVILHSGADADDVELAVEGTVLGERLPNQLVFTQIFDTAYFDGVNDEAILPAALKWIDDPFDDPTLTRFTRYTEGSMGTFIIEGGLAKITQFGGIKTDWVGEGTPLNVPEVMVTVDVVSRSGTSGAYEIYGVGVIKDGNNFIDFHYDAKQDWARIQVKINGVNTFYNDTHVGWGFPPYKLGMSIVGNRVYGWIFRNNAWTCVMQLDLIVKVDFKAQNLALWQGAFIMATPGTSSVTVSFDNLKVGRYGGCGIRDLQAVVNENGDYVGTHEVMCLATLACPLDGVINGSQAVVKVNILTGVITQTGLIMVSRGGKIQNDAAGQILHDAQGNQRVLMSTWGDLSTAYPTILHKQELLATQDLLATGVHVISGMTELSLSTNGNNGRYDPSLMKVGSYWYLAYTVANVGAWNFYPVLDRSTDLIVWTKVGDDPTHTRFEGSRLAIFENVLYALAGGNLVMRVYDTATMAFICNLNLNIYPPGTTQPHPMIIPYGNYQYMLTFDGTKWPVGGSDMSWGHGLIYRSPRYQS